MEVWLFWTATERQAVFGEPSPEMAVLPFQTLITDSVPYARLCLQADGGERTGEETQKLWAE